jgi:hypothetical protein
VTQYIPGAPFPSAKSVTPATLSDIFIFSAIICNAGQNLKQQNNVNESLDGETIDITKLTNCLQLWQVQRIKKESIHSAQTL